mgnify:CR=1 FL=1
MKLSSNPPAHRVLVWEVGLGPGLVEDYGSRAFIAAIALLEEPAVARRAEAQEVGAADLARALEGRKREGCLQQGEFAAQPVRSDGDAKLGAIPEARLGRRDGGQRRAGLALERLKAHPQVNGDKLAAIGYCFGGTTVLELAYSGADIAGVVSFHGGLTAPRPGDMSRITAKILVLHGADDAFIPPEKIAAFQEGVTKAGADWQMIYYGGAVHSFTNPAADKKNINGLAYSPSADERSWAAMQAFLAEVLS